MTDYQMLCVQFQPELATGLDRAVVKAVLQGQVLRDYFVDCEIHEGEDNGPYVNFLFRSEDVSNLWNALLLHAYQALEIGPLLLRSTVVTCEGKHGWSDYRLLHHFDSSPATDKVINRATCS